MNIDFKARIRNKAWWCGIISVILLLSQQLSFDLSTYIPSNYETIINAIFTVLAMLGVTVDTSTPTLSDNK